MSGEPSRKLIALIDGITVNVKRDANTVTIEIPKNSVLPVESRTNEGVYTVTYTNDKGIYKFDVGGNEINTNYKLETQYTKGGYKRQRRSRTRKTHRKRRSNYRKTR